MVKMGLKNPSKYAFLCFIAALLFAVTGIANTLSGNSSALMVALPWISAMAFAVIGFRELAGK
jgi:hypothetical protein